jgi:hypothetical protein
VLREREKSDFRRRVPGEGERKLAAAAPAPTELGAYRRVRWAIGRSRRYFAPLNQTSLVLEGPKEDPRPPVRARVAFTRGCRVELSTRSSSSSASRALVSILMPTPGARAGS